ncbi:glycosyltransferase family 1 protein [Terribacillus aidingensis]|uniref:glycosyltransferase family 4 protein n=1 Tax=Terribacillus aidingensis TaxID=586416 RepID=UPI00344ED365
MKKVLIDAHNVGVRTAGNEVYFENLVMGLSKNNNKLDLSVLIKDDKWVPHNINKVDLKSNSVVLQRGLEIPYQVKKGNFDLLHVPFAIPPVNFSKTLVTVHDILFEDFKEFFSKSTLKRLKLTTPITTRKCTHITTVSNYSKESIMEKYGIEEQKITMIPNSLSLSFENALNTVTSDTIHKTKRELNIIEDYILFVGTVQPRKNIARIIESFKFSNAYNDLKLVIAGGRGWLYEEIFSLVKELNIENRVIFTGSISDIELANLYKGSTMLVYPTIAEGFGIPLLEAMASGIPIITSNTTALPEVAGKAAIYVDPYNISEISDAIRTLLHESKTRDDLVEQGTKELSRYSRDKTSVELVRLYEKILGE